MTMTLKEAAARYRAAVAEAERLDEAAVALNARALTARRAADEAARRVCVAQSDVLAIASREPTPGPSRPNATASRAEPDSPDGAAGPEASGNQIPRTA